MENQAKRVFLVYYGSKAEERIVWGNWTWEQAEIKLRAELKEEGKEGLYSLISQVKEIPA